VIRYNLRSNNVIHSFWVPKLAGKVDLIPGRANWMWMMADTPQQTPDVFGVYYGQCAQYCGESHAYMLFRARVVSDEEFVQWIADNKTFRFPPGHEPDAAGLSQPPEKVQAAAKDAWAKFQAAGKADPKSLTTPEQKGAYVFMNTCVLCHTINGTLAQGLLGPNLTRVASRTALAAGILDNLDAKALEKDPRSIQIDPKLQAENLYNWITHSYDYKPGNLMWYPKNGLKDILDGDAKNGAPVTDEDFHNIVAFLQTLK
jgi:cytochrome c oxidase subunit 2